MDQQAVQARIDARRRAAVVADLASDEAIAIPEPARDVFWEELWKLCMPPQARPSAVGPKPMSDRQARAFGAVPMPFGQHRGTRVDEIPLAYLERLVEPNRFLKELRRYLASRRIQAEQSDVPADDD